MLRSPGEKASGHRERPKHIGGIRFIILDLLKILKIFKKMVRESLCGSKPFVVLLSRVM